jgi:undecaprenyl diphosphate synthase
MRGFVFSVFQVRTGGFGVWKNWFSQRKSKWDNANETNYQQLDKQRMPQHVAIIMDGNGRWARSKGMPRSFGHRAGAETLREIVKTASEIGIKVLTAYAFSTENWKRPTDEVNLLMSLLSNYLDNEINELHENNVKIQFIGQIDGLSSKLQQKIAAAEKQTQDNQGLILNLAVNYGGRAEITRAMRLIAEQVACGNVTPSNIDDQTIQDYLYTSDLPDPDLLIRPSGDLRISNFLLWQLAYTEFWFTGVNWPDFKPEHFIDAILEFQRRDRRFGGLTK